MAKIILYIVGFVLLVGVLGVVTAKIYGIELGKDPSEMDARSRALYLALWPLWKIAEFVSAPFRR